MALVWKAVSVEVAAWQNIKYIILMKYKTFIKSVKYIKYVEYTWKEVLWRSAMERGVC